MTGILDPSLALWDATGDRLDGDAVQDLVVAHLVDLCGQDVLEPGVPVREDASKARVETAHQLHQE